MSEMSDMFKLVNQMELAKTARVGMELTYFDVIELLGELDSLKTCIAELESAQRWRVVANGELPKKNDYYWAHDDLGQQGMILFYDGEWNKFTNLSYITHWMPLPELPELPEVQE